MRRYGLLLVGLGLLVSAGLVRPRTLRDDGAALSAVPPEVALANIALGGLNGLLVDFLWLRAGEQQEQGRYFEMVQTAQWIAALQPQMGKLYDFQAWNMAFNISAEFDDAGDRWRWIERGLRLLTEDGLVNDPNDPQVDLSLATIITGKVADYLDRDHYVYKRIWADEWSWILGGARPDLDLLNGALTRAELDADPQVQALLDAAHAVGCELPDQAWLYTHPGAKPPAEISKVLNHPAHADALAKVLATARRERLCGLWHLTTTRIAAIDAEYGPFDWRSGQAHGVYWAAEAIRKSGGREHSKQAARVLYQTLWSAFQRGRLIYQPGTDLIFPTPDLRLLPRVEAEYGKMLTLFPGDPNLVRSHQLFLEDTVLALFTFNRQREAEQQYAKLQRLYPEAKDYQQPFGPYVIAAIGGLAGGDVTEVTRTVVGMLTTAWQWYALGDDAQAAGTERLARLIAQRYRETAGDDPSAALPPFSALRQAALELGLKQTLPEPLRESLRARLTQVGGKEPAE